MTALYILLAFEAAILIAWITYALNTEFELYCWINKKRVFRGYFDTLGDLNDYVYKLEALHGDSLTDWTIRTVRKHRFVKQISGKEKAELIKAIALEEGYQDQLNKFEYRIITLQNAIDSSKQVIERTKQFLNEN